MLSDVAAQINDAGEIAFGPCEVFGVYRARSFDYRIGDEVSDVLTESRQHWFEVVALELWRL